MIKIYKQAFTNIPEKISSINVHDNIPLSRAHAFKTAFKLISGVLWYLQYSLIGDTAVNHYAINL